PFWTNKGLLGFTATDSVNNTQIYLWDGKVATDISQNPTTSNGAPTWSADGRWAFATFDSQHQVVYVRDAQNKPLLTVEGQSPAWSPGGYLTFCDLTSTGWKLLIWDGSRVTKVAQGVNIVTEWQGGSWSVCSSG